MAGTYSDPALILPGTVGKVELGVDVVSDLDNARMNGALNAFEISILKTESMHNMLDGVKDVFNDAAGILSGGVVSGGVVKASGTLLYDEQGIVSTSSEAYVLQDTYVVTADGVHTLTCEYRTSNVGYYAYVDIRKNGSSIGSDSTLSTAWIEKVVSGSWLTDDIITVYTKQFNNGYTAYLQKRDIYNDVAQDIISNSVTAESQPTNIHAVILADDAAITLNTDLKFYASVDNGATWEQITLANSGDYSATERILTGSVAVAGTGITIKYKIECTQVNYEIYAVGLLWD